MRVHFSFVNANRLLLERISGQGIRGSSCPLCGKPPLNVGATYGILCRRCIFCEVNNRVNTFRPLWVHYRKHFLTTYRNSATVYCTLKVYITIGIVDQYDFGWRKLSQQSLTVKPNTVSRFAGWIYRLLLGRVDCKIWARAFRDVIYWDLKSCRFGHGT